MLAKAHSLSTILFPAWLRGNFEEKRCIVSFYLVFSPTTLPSAGTLMLVASGIGMRILTTLSFNRVWARQVTRGTLHDHWMEFIVEYQIPWYGLVLRWYRALVYSR